MVKGRGEVEELDVIVVGGGPAGSVCARTLVDAGLRVLVLDRQRFPRVKLCAGWVSLPIWDVIGVRPSDYPLGLWPWGRCHVHYDGVDQTIVASGHFIRRYEFDEFLLRRSGARVIEGHQVKSIVRTDEGAWEIDGRFRATSLVGAGGTHCPVARVVFAPRSDRPVGVQEIEFEADASEVAASRAGGDGEPELLLHRDLSGYSWNVPKTDWLNVGAGTDEPREVHAAWQTAREHFEARGHIPVSASDALAKPKGYSYHLFDPIRFRSCQQGSAFLVGDALGLAHPLTAEGILPAALSGKLCAEAIIDGEPQSYGPRLAAHPLMQDYTLVFRLRELSGSLRRAIPGGGGGRSRMPAFVGEVSRRAVASGFAWMFAGKPLPARRAIAGLTTFLERGWRSPFGRALAARSASSGGHS